MFVFIFSRMKCFGLKVKEKSACQMCGSLRGFSCILYDIACKLPMTYDFFIFKWSQCCNVSRCVKIDPSNLSN